MKPTGRGTVGAIFLGAAAFAGSALVQTATNKPSHIVNIHTLPPVLKPTVLKKSGFIPTACAGLKNGALLTCWLEQFPLIAQSISWENHDKRTPYVDTISWPEWPQWRRAALEEAFVDARVWYEGGMTLFTGTPIPDPPPNMEESFGNQFTVLDEQTAAWPLYLAYVAHGLAGEIYGWVPWSLRNYDAEELQALFSTHLRMFVYDSGIGDLYDVNYPGYILVTSTTPSHPTFAFKFLAANNLIGATPTKTIGNLLEWSRTNLSHYFGASTYDNFQQYWQYWGGPPVRRMLEGTHLTDPEYADQYGDLRHWTSGCYGTTDFLVWVLRTVNIPAERKSSDATCGHATPHFLAEQLYLSHGDDPYTSLSDASFPALYLLIGKQTWKGWFETGGQQTSCDNVGRRPVELSVWYLGDHIVGKYCADVLNGKDHASGDVYATYSKYYSVAQLEAADLWGRLAAAAPTSGAWQCASF